MIRGKRHISLYCRSLPAGLSGAAGPKEYHVYMLTEIIIFALFRRQLQSFAGLRRPFILRPRHVFRNRRLHHGRIFDPHPRASRLGRDSAWRSWPPRWWAL